MFGLAILLLSGLLFTWALLPFFITESKFLWKATVVATEFGPWIALFCGLALIVVFFAQGRRIKPKLTVSAAMTLFTASALLFLLPIFEFEGSARAWSADLAKNFGLAQKDTAMDFDFGQFLFGSLYAVQVMPRTIEFGKVGETPLTFQFYAAQSVKKAPWVLLVHGGGWDSGTAKDLPEINSYLAEEGYAAISVEYRLAPKWPWPAPREDVEKAVAYLKAHAEELNLDPERWAILGRSAGGQIAESVGYQMHDPALKGIIAFYAPSDLDFAYKFSHENDALNSRVLMRNYLGGDNHEKPEAYHDASPIEFVNAKSPPTLLLHGGHDSIVWVKHSERLLAKLRSNQVPSAFVEIPWATHGFDYNLFGPGGQVASESIKIFLRKVF